MHQHTAGRKDCNCFPSGSPCHIPGADAPSLRWPWACVPCSGVIALQVMHQHRLLGSSGFPPPEVFQSHGGMALRGMALRDVALRDVLVGMVEMGQWLDWAIFDVFSNLTDFRTLISMEQTVSCLHSMLWPPNYPVIYTAICNPGIPTPPTPHSTAAAGGSHRAAVTHRAPRAGPAPTRTSDTPPT